MVAGEVGLAIDHHVPAVEYATALAPARIELTVSSITSARTGQSERGTTSQAPYRGLAVASTPRWASGEVREWSQGQRDRVTHD